MENQITLSIGGNAAPSLVVNGVELADAITADWRLDVVTEGGQREARLTVTYPVALP